MESLVSNRTYLFKTSQSTTTKDGTTGLFSGLIDIGATRTSLKLLVPVSKRVEMCFTGQLFRVEFSNRQTFKIVNYPPQNSTADNQSGHPVVQPYCRNTNERVAD